MTLRHLKVFVAVCEHNGITKAAQALHMVQPAVSTTIAELERHYNIRLFDRINQRLVITELGRELLVKAKQLLAEFDEFEANATLGGQNPKLRIGSSLTLGKTILPAFLSQIQERLPALEASFTIDKTSVIEKKLEFGELDFGIVEGAVHSEHLKAFPIGEDRLVAVCSPRLSAPKELPLEELLCYPLLLREKGSASRDLFEQALSDKGLSLAKPLLESSSNEALLAFAEADHGVAILPLGIASPAIALQALRTLTVSDAKFNRRHYIVMHKSKRFSPLCQAAIDTMEQLMLTLGA